MSPFLDDNCSQVEAQTEATPIESNRKQKQKNKRSQLQDLTPASTDTERSETETRTRKRTKSISQPAPVPMSAARTLPLLICSVGNPGATYANTFHSAGHTVLNRLAEHLGTGSFQKSREYGNGLVSKGNEWTLWQSTSYMNDSGKGVRAAYMAWAKTIPDGEGKLVIVHDELEKPLGAVSLRTTQGASAKGHNGLKSIMSVMGQTPFARIGVGIGRPVSRSSNDVARYVLSKMTPAEKAKVDGSVEGIIAKLQQLEKE
ncbi:peptidyl-trna hydrolase [Acrodontium crateriforme]|uniref:peptidyl-tRNA hydrolase n=1 Tax=Acrodontium crateriforme TaxID=150365 RepID=A0AAQ3M5L4_9PEZI|nr:peptidyl-trna hydrolase [Acrodontium crateriforme]